MPHRPRFATGGLAYHVLNRRVARMPLFENAGDYAAFEHVLQETFDRTGIRIAAYCLMPNHWHLLLWPRQDGDLSEAMRWLTVTHTQRWHAHRGTSGTGPVYQGRYKSFPVQTDEHFLIVARYVERNALRATLVVRAEGWRWSSLWRRSQGNPELMRFLSDWPVEQPRQWIDWVNGPEAPEEVAGLREHARRGRPLGNAAWVARTAARLGLEFTLRPRGRPKKAAA